MFDFTIKIYEELLETFLAYGYKFYMFADFLVDSKLNDKCIILRHDVDKFPKNALNKAIIEQNLSISSTYNFRIVKGSNDPHIIEKIVSLGHEIGYHYEEISLTKGDFEKAILLFEKNLQYFRKFYPVRTICMHGSPMSKWDNRILWEKNNYKDFGIVGEPYFDIDFNDVFYVTDTSRSWNHKKANIRDKVETIYDIRIKSTYHMIELIKKDSLPTKIMINTHPQRWSNNLIEWLTEFLFQKVKNIYKNIGISNAQSSYNSTG